MHIKCRGSNKPLHFIFDKHYTYYKRVLYSQHKGGNSMAGNKGDQIKKINETLKVLFGKQRENEKKYNIGMEDIRKDILEAKQGIEDCHSRIRDLQKSYKQGNLTESSFYKKEESYKTKISKYNAKIFKLEDKKAKATKSFQEKEVIINQRVGTLNAKLRELRGR